MGSGLSHLKCMPSLALCSESPDCHSKSLEGLCFLTPEVDLRFLAVTTGPGRIRAGRLLTRSAPSRFVTIIPFSQSRTSVRYSLKRRLRSLQSCIAWLYIDWSGPSQSLDRRNNGISWSCTGDDHCGHFADTATTCRARKH